MRRGKQEQENVIEVCEKRLLAFRSLVLFKNFGLRRIGLGFKEHHTKA